MTTPPSPQPEEIETVHVEVEIYPPQCHGCDNFNSEGKGNAPICLEGMVPSKCVDSTTTRFIPRGGRKEVF